MSSTTSLPHDDRFATILSGLLQLRCDPEYGKKDTVRKQLKQEIARLANKYPDLDLVMESIPHMTRETAMGCLQYMHDVQALVTEHEMSILSALQLVQHKYASKKAAKEQKVKDRKKAKKQRQRQKKPIHCSPYHGLTTRNVPTAVGCDDDSLEWSLEEFLASGAMEEVWRSPHFL